MFDEVSRVEQQEKINYQPTTWSRLENKENTSPQIIPMPEVKNEEAGLMSDTAKQAGSIFSGMFGIIDYIRDIVKKNEDIIIIAIILLVIADSDDNIELMIALAILLLPYISGPITGLFKK